MYHLAGILVPKPGNWPLPVPDPMMRRLVFGYQGEQWLTALRPGVEFRVTGAAQWRREQDRALDVRVVTPLQRKLGAKGPAQQPEPRQVEVSAVADGRRDIVPLGQAGTGGDLPCPSGR